MKKIEIALQRKSLKLNAQILSHLVIKVLTI